ncbi:hypothetical protein IV498_11325 [Paenarthrobacter sp. Z7-10]|uniref:hypothetical protein n=1 Tax=Paenarthrobacter sp. Z7-10 TaxID=2787635 RepID=UPI0022A955AB|nr:hypothetical protein [Paenarthrobacter sp. Z7-10]MCZ2403761.1 hypothetical protein [Paenarthrobacter sp. Z7-10]
MTEISALPVRGRALCCGTVHSVTILPPGEPPQFSAIVTDVDDAVDAPKAGRKVNHRVRLIWLGRRRVPGIGAGTELRFEGMVSIRDGLPTVFNPRYEIIGKQET